MACKGLGKGPVWKQRDAPVQGPHDSGRWRPLQVVAKMMFQSRLWSPEHPQNWNAVSHRARMPYDAKPSDAASVPWCCDRAFQFPEAIRNEAAAPNGTCSSLQRIVAEQACRRLLSNSAALSTCDSDRPQLYVSCQRSTPFLTTTPPRQIVFYDIDVAGGNLASSAQIMSGSGLSRPKQVNAR